MIKPEDLLAFSRDLVSGPRGPEASARRAVSGAYYALFHAISQAGAALFLADAPTRDRLARSYDHSALGRAAQAIETSGKRGGGGVEPDPRLVHVAAGLRELRDARELADYDLRTKIGWDEAEAAVQLATSACSALNEIGTHPETAAFLLAPLAQRRASRG